MKKNRQVSPLSPKKWAIPLPAKPRGQWHFDEDVVISSSYDNACQMLKNLGFDQLSDMHSFDLSYLSRSSKPRKFSLWSHPGGAFVRASQSSCGIDLNDLSLDVEFNVGFDRARYKKLGALGGSGGTYINQDGTDAFEQRFDCKPGSNGFLQTLYQIQKSAKLVPIDAWKRKNEMGLYIPENQYYTFLPEEEDYDLPNGQLKEKYAEAVRAAQENLINKAPDYAKKALIWSFSQRVIKPLNETDWMRSESALDLYGEIFRAGNISWPSPAESELLSKWSLLCLPENPLPPFEACAADQDIGGVSLPHALFACISKNGNKDKLVSLLGQSEDRLLKKWSGAPDVSGHTLFSHALALLGSHRHVAGSSMLGRAISFEDARDILDDVVGRVGTENVVVSPEGRPALGALIELISDPSRKPGGNPPLMSAILQLEKQVAFIIQAEDWGVSCFEPGRASDIEMFGTLKENAAEWAPLRPLMTVLEKKLLSHLSPRQSAPSVSSSLRL